MCSSDLSSERGARHAGGACAGGCARLCLLAIPGMGTGVGGVAHADAAAMMIKEIWAFIPKALQAVVLVDVDPAMVQAWREALTETKRLEKGQR